MGQRSDVKQLVTPTFFVLKVTSSVTLQGTLDRCHSYLVFAYLQDGIQ